MPTIHRFEELLVWKIARELCQEIYLYTNRVEFNHDYSLKNQIRASAGSGMDNIAEGFERGSRKEFIQFLTIAKGSVGETRSQLYRALDAKYITTKEFESAQTKCLNLAKMLYSFIEHLKKSEIKGIRYKVQEESVYYGNDQPFSMDNQFFAEE